MKLFNCEQNPRLASIFPAGVDTPLGKVLLNVKIDKVQIEAIKATESYQLQNDTHFLCWYQDDFDLELLIGRPVLHLPVPAIVQDCIAGMWRLKPHKDLENILFTAEWSPGYSWRKGSPDSGEGLYAKTWWDKGNTVSIGTEDEKWLAFRASRNAMLPPRLENYFKQGFFDELVHYDLQETGLPIPIASLRVGELCQVHFSVAWSDNVSGDASTWYAVKCSPTDILDGCECS